MYLIDMCFKRILDESFPNNYYTWWTEDTTWVIQDLVEENDEEAIKILVEACRDETLSHIQNITEDTASMQRFIDSKRDALKQRMSIGCYKVKNGRKTLVGVNICVVQSAREFGFQEVEVVEENYYYQRKTDKWRNVVNALKYVKKLVNPYESMGLSHLLWGRGLVVSKEYQGASLGKRLLDAREPLCRYFGIQGTAAVFTGIASQKLAASCGFQTIADISMKELAGAGLPYPADDPRRIKCMVKKYYY